MPLKDIKELSPQELQAFMASRNRPVFHARQVFSWIYARRAGSFDEMSNLPADLRSALKENFSLSSVRLDKSIESRDGTKKLLLGLRDNNLVEAVLIPAEKRVTGCISSQVGCKFCCRFCASGMLGFKRNLSAAEMLDEVLFLKDNSGHKKLTHIVFMGTGEPLDNYDNVLKTIRVLNSPFGLNIGSRRITISTSGVIPGILKLAQENLQIELSVSLHAATEETRDLLMPVNKIYPLRQLMKAAAQYISKTNRQVTFEYILIKGVNSDLKNAQKLCKILKGLLCKVNLIPANTIKELNIGPPGRDEVLSFKKALLGSGITATLRKPRGEDIEAACGQLRLKYEKNLFSR